MGTNRSYKRRLFTLVELMIAISIGLVVLAIAGTVFVQIAHIYRETTTDYTLTQRSRMVRMQLLSGSKLNGMGLREAQDIQINTVDGVISFKANGVDCQLEIEKGKKLTYTRGGKAGQMLKYDVEVADFNVDQELGRRKKDGESDKEYRKRVMIRLLLKMKVGGISYYTEQFINAVIKND